MCKWMSEILRREVWHFKRKKTESQNPVVAMWVSVEIHSDVESTSRRWLQCRLNMATLSDRVTPRGVCVPTDVIAKFSFQKTTQHRCDCLH